MYFHEIFIQCITSLFPDFSELLHTELEGFLAQTLTKLLHNKQAGRFTFPCEATQKRFHKLKLHTLLTGSV